MNTAAPPGMPPTPPAIRVLFVLLPHSLTLDWAGPAEVLRSANSVLRGMGLPPRFALGFVGPLPEQKRMHGNQKRQSSGFSIQKKATVADLACRARQNTRS